MCAAGCSRSGRGAATRPRCWPRSPETSSRLELLAPGSAGARPRSAHPARLPERPHRDRRWLARLARGGAVRRRAGSRGGARGAAGASRSLGGRRPPRDAARAPASRPGADGVSAARRSVCRAARHGLSFRAARRSMSPDDGGRGGGRRGRAVVRGARTAARPRSGKRATRRSPWSRRSRSASSGGRWQGVLLQQPARGTRGERLGLRGWVRNEPGGGVTLHVQGDAAAVDAMLVVVQGRPPGGARESRRGHPTRRPTSPFPVSR